MTDKEKIKEEIERIEQILDDFNKTHNNTIDNGIVTAKKNICKHIKSFIDSLPEEPANEDLEEEIKNYIQKEYPDGIGFPNVPKIAHHFAEWQKKKDQETIEIAEDHAMLAGMNKMKEEMMKDALNCSIIMHPNDRFANYSISAYVPPLHPASTYISNGDKVKIIIVKEEQ